MSLIKQKYRRSFWQKLPIKAYSLFALSVFFSFSIFGFASDLLNKLSEPVPLILVLAFYCGVVAVGWAYSFTRNRKAIIWALILQFGLMFIPWNEIFPNTNNLIQSHKLIFDAVGIYLGVILGYIFFIILITHEGIKQIELKTEMDLASGMHQVLVPPIDYKDNKFEIFGKSNPALEIGGDLIDLYKSEKHLTAYIADVSGHGIDAGLLMGMFKSALYSRLESDITLTNLINEANKSLHKLKKPNMFITCSMIRFNSDYSIEYLNAGHLPVLYFNKGQKRVEHLLIKQIPITVRNDFSFTSKIINYFSGDIFLLLTDGIVEVMNEKGDELGINKIEEILIENSDQNAGQIFDRLMVEVNKFGKQKDDQSAIIIKVI